MPADVQRAKNFLLTTDYPLDKVVYLNSGSATVPFPTAGFLVTIPHHLPFTPLVSGNWALTSNFSVSYEYGSGTFPSNNAGAQLFNIKMDIYADATNVYVSPVNVSGSPAVIYYRIFGLEPSDSQADLPFTASAGDSFVLNTDFNYTKLYVEEVITSPSKPSTQTILTNLNYRPQVMPWLSNSLGNRLPVDYTQISAGGTPVDYGVVITVNTVDYQLDALSTVTRIDTRIYIDENA
jgi:hypothetical protein